MHRAVGILLGIALFAPAIPSAADTLIVVGVAVSKDGQRVPGAQVGLYATSNKVGKPLAQDRTSDRGIFNLYRSNIAGDLGELYVLYEGDSGVASPVKVSLKSPANALIDARTNDLIVLPPLPQNAQLSQDEAAQRIAAIVQTQSVLVKAGVIDQAKADVEVEAKSTATLNKVLLTTAGDVKSMKEKTEFKLMDFKSLMLGKEAATRAIEKQAMLIRDKS